MRRWGILVLTVFLLSTLAGCSAAREEETERREVDYTVVEERKLPPELLEILEENKENEIRMAYTDEGETYLIRGYGEQKTGGYSIAVVGCTEDETSVFLETRLMGPANQENLSKEPSYPYVAVKIESREKEARID